MLSIVDLIEAGTMTRDLAAYALAAIGRGASFMVGALPGGAGKTTVMGALLNFVPRDAALVSADGDEAILRLMRERSRRCCCVCHEIGDGPYYAYLWGEPLRRYFDLPDAGHMMATNLHADTYAAARRQVCEQNRVAPSKFRRMNVIYFLTVERQARGTMRRVTGVWESDGEHDHRPIFGDGVQGLPYEASTLVAPNSFHAANETVDRLMTTGARSIAEVRAVVLQERPDERLGATEGGAVEVPINGVLDLHMFRPADVGDLVPTYLEECRKRGILQVRIIHGKGIGALRETVHAILRRMPEVATFGLAPDYLGGWGATVVELRGLTK